MGRVALIGENSIEYIEILLTIWGQGDCAVLIDWRIPFLAAYDMIRDSEAYMCVVEDSYVKEINLDDYPEVKFLKYSRKKNVAEELPVGIRSKYHANYLSTEALILFSSGTTGKSKGIILSHKAISNNADSIIEYMKLSDKDCFYIAKTLAHSSTLVGELLVALKTGKKVIVAPTIVPPRFVLNNLIKFDVSIICLNPSLLLMYAEEYKRRKYTIPSLRCIYVSGAILYNKHLEMAKNAFNGVDIYNVYGLTEAGPRVSAQRCDCNSGVSVGKPISNVKICIRDENGRKLSEGEKGVICVSSPCLYSGYVKGIRKREIDIFEEINTGDIGYIDHGELYIVGRIDDVINTDAHKIFPEDVERCILNEVNVDDCIVVGENVDGEVSLVCYYQADHILSNSEIKKLRKRLAVYEIPRKFCRVDKIPQGFNGKKVHSDGKGINIWSKN